MLVRIELYARLNCDIEDICNCHMFSILCMHNFLYASMLSSFMHCVLKSLCSLPNFYAFIC
jgi:hypothetical protein